MNFIESFINKILSWLAGYFTGKKIADKNEAIYRAQEKLALEKAKHEIVSVVDERMSNLSERLRRKKAQRPETD